MKRTHCLCPLVEQREDTLEIRIHKGSPQLPFRMLGLLAWGTDETSKLHVLQFGNDSVATVDVGPVPLAVFDVRNMRLDEPLTFDRAQQLAKDNKLGAALQPFQKLGGLTKYPGQLITLHIEGPCTALALYGFTFEHSTSPYTAKIVEAGKGFTGLLSYDDVDGVAEVCRVEAPDSLSAATLLAGAMRSGRYGRY